MSGFLGFEFATTGPENTNIQADRAYFRVPLRIEMFSAGGFLSELYRTSFFFGSLDIQVLAISSGASGPPLNLCIPFKLLWCWP